MPHFLDSRTELECDPLKNELRVHENWAFILPFYIDILGNSGGEQTYYVKSCTLNGIQTALNNKEWLYMTKHLFKNPSAYNIDLNKK
jgi:hypothetical protein